MNAYSQKNNYLQAGAVSLSACLFFCENDVEMKLAVLLTATSLLYMFKLLKIGKFLTFLMV